MRNQSIVVYCIVKWYVCMFYTFHKHHTTNNFGFVTKPFECNCIFVLFCSALLPYIPFDSHLLFFTIRVPCVPFAVILRKTIIQYRSAKVQRYIIFAPLRKQKTTVSSRFISRSSWWQFSIRKRNAVVYCLLLYCVCIESPIWAVKPSMESSFSPHEWTRCTQLQHFCRF